jgi:hypothetical protein
MTEKGSFLLNTDTKHHEARLARTRFRAIGLATAFLLLMNGCASVRTIPNPAESPRPNPSVLVVAPARFEPASKIAPVLRTKEEAAAEGAASGAKAGVSESLRGLPYGILFLPVFVPIGAVIGSVTETSVAAPDELIASGRQAIEGVIPQLHLQQRMAQSVVTELRAEAVGKVVSVNENVGPVAPDERPIYRDVAAPVVLEVSVMEFGFSKGVTKTGTDGYTLDVTTNARLLDTEHQTVLDEMKHTHRSEPYTATEWLQDNAENFTRAVDEAIQSNARDIVLEFFLLYYPPMAVAPKGDDKPIVPYYVLKPIYPESVGMRFTLVDGLQPTFQWEAFPRRLDLAGREGKEGQFTDVSYELSVFQAIPKGGGAIRKQYVAGPLLYKRTGLPEPWHHMEEPLQPCGRYAWTVRARFKLDGQPRVTEWTGFYTINTLLHPPWHFRRSIPPSDFISRDVSNPQLDVFSRDGSEFYLLFRAPPPEGAAECGD